MSNENLNNFISKVSTDEVLGKQLGANASPDQIVAIGKSAGFDFSADDVQSAIDAESASATELDESELEQVVGAGYKQEANALFGTRLFCRKPKPVPVGTVVMTGPTINTVEYPQTVPKKK